MYPLLVPIQHDSNSRDLDIQLTLGPAQTKTSINATLHDWCALGLVHLGLEVLEKSGEEDFHVVVCKESSYSNNNP